jgi:6-phosphogluconolactonase
MFTGSRLVVASLLSVVSLSSISARGIEDIGAVYTMTNSSAGNTVVAYSRSADGTLNPAGTFATGGVGSGAGLTSQDAIVVTADRRFVLAVNAGSNSVSVFRIRHDALQLVDTESSGGVMPTSIAVRNGLVVVLNAGAPNNITGLHLSPSGQLSHIPGFTRPLSAAQAAPAQVGFSHDGDTIVVTERATNTISTFAFDGDQLNGPFLTPSAGPTPFGFASGARNTLLVSEAGAGGGASTYRIDGTAVDAVSSAIMTGQRAACWAVLTPNSRFGYVTNAGTGNISGFEISPDGSAALLPLGGVTAVTGGNPTDLAMSHDGRYLYARVANLASIAVFRIGADGSLTALPSLTGTPAGLAGLAGF